MLTLPKKQLKLYLKKQFNKLIAKYVTNPTVLLSFSNSTLNANSRNMLKLAMKGNDQLFFCTFSNFAVTI